MKRLWVVSLLVLSGCGPFVSGTWRDHPKNWKRAFGESQPGEGISVVHSWYMRTPHFTAEFAWFFQLELSAKAKGEIVGSSDLTRLPLSAEELRSRIYQDRPAWFAPEPLSAYDVYESKTERDFLIFVEKSGGRSFWTRYQL
jgi:hypothetical protein